MELNGLKMTHFHATWSYISLWSVLLYKMCNRQKQKKQKQQKTAKYELNIPPPIENMLRRKWQMAFASIMA